MIIDTKAFFSTIRAHHWLPPAARPADIRNRLSAMADPANAASLRVTSLTQRCLSLFLARRPTAS